MSGRNQHLRWCLPLGVFVLALVLRTVDLADNPPGFFRDEAEKGYTSWSLLHAGTDMAGREWPLFVKSFAVYTSSVYQYADIPIIGALGLTEFAVRLPAALAGSLTVLFAFLLMRRLFDWRTGLAVALILAFSPWHLLFSRWANQGIFLPLGLITGCYCLAGFREARKWPVLVLWGLGAVAAWTLALYSYAPAKVLVPVLFPVALVVFLWRPPLEAKSRGIIQPALLVALLVALALPLLVFQADQTEQAQARFDRISVFKDDAALPTVTARFAKNMARHLSPAFQFMSGDGNPRHNFGGVGVYLALDALLLMAALVATIRTRNRYLIFFWFWWLLGFVPASLTMEGIPHALRSIGGLAAGCLLAGRGAVWLWEAALQSERLSRKAGRAIVAVFILLYLGVIGGFLWGAFMEYPRQPLVRVAWQAGWDEAVAKFEQQQRLNKWPEMKELHITPQASAEFPHVFFLFYGKVDPTDPFTWGVGMANPPQPGDVILHVQNDPWARSLKNQPGVETVAIRMELGAPVYEVTVKVDDAQGD